MARAALQKQVWPRSPQGLGCAKTQTCCGAVEWRSQVSDVSSFSREILAAPTRIEEECTLAYMSARRSRNNGDPLLKSRTADWDWKSLAMPPDSLQKILGRLHPASSVNLEFFIALTARPVPRLRG
jgi:hypothetical protein